MSAPFSPQQTYTPQELLPSKVRGLVLAHWSDQSDDETVGETMKGILDSIRNVAGGKKTDVQFIFLNYASVLELELESESSGALDS